MSRKREDELDFETVLSEMVELMPATSAALLGEVIVTHNRKASKLELTCQHVIIFKWPNHECWIPSDVITKEEIVGVTDENLDTRMKELTDRITAISKINTAKAYGRFLQFRYRKPLLDLAYQAYCLSNTKLKPFQRGRDWDLDGFKQVVLPEIKLNREEEVKIHAEIWKEFSGEVGTTRPPAPDNPFISN